MKRNIRIEKKWRKSREYIDNCPHCYSMNLKLHINNERFFKRYSVECGNCHWTWIEKRTIKDAVKAWNTQPKSTEDMYGGEHAI